MGRPTWIRAEDGDLYRASAVVAVKTVPHAQGGHSVVVETQRHDNVDVTGHIGDDGVARAGRDELAALLSRAEKGSVIVYANGRFRAET